MTKIKVIMMSFVRNIVIFLMRESQGESGMRERFPPINENFSIRLLRGLQVHRLFKKCIYHLSDRSRHKVLNTLVNYFRISWVFVPPEDLKKKYSEALIYLKSNFPKDDIGDYLEFGVYQGTSMICMYETLKDLQIDDVRLFGFDSFEGLPSPEGSDDIYDQKNWTEGQFKSDLQFTREELSKIGVDWTRVSLIKGFFSETLTDDFKVQHAITKASIIMIDCDMYLSTKEALSFCEPLIYDQAFIFFDDWNCTGDDGGEKKAFYEFLKQNTQFGIEEFGTYFSNAQIFRIFRKMT